MRRVLTWVSGIFVVAAVMGSGCVNSTSSPAPGAASPVPAAGQIAAATDPAAATRQAVSVAQRAVFTRCPADVGAARLVVFDDRSWTAHLASAAEPVTDLAGWAPDFSRQSLVLVALGQKSTLGHSIAIGEAMRDDAGHVTLPVTRASPAAGAMSAMALSSPCAYALLDTADIERLDVVDAADGDILQRWSR